MILLLLKMLRLLKLLRLLRHSQSEWRHRRVLQLSIATLSKHFR